MASIRWRPTLSPPALVDLAAALAVLFAWHGSIWWWSSQGWLPRHSGAWALAGWWLAGAVAIRRVAPPWLLCGTMLLYPLAYMQPLRNDLHLAPILVLGFAAAQRRATVAALAASTVAVLVFFSPIVGSDVSPRIGWVGSPDISQDAARGPGIRGPWEADWSAVVVVEMATVAVVLLGSVSAAQRAGAQALAEQNQELERLRRADAIRAADEERLRISRELHDVVAHHLTAILMRSQAAHHVADRRPEEAVDAVAWIARSSREALEATRQTVSSLRSERDRPPEASLVEELSELASRMADLGITVSVDVDEDPGPRPGSASDVVLRRVVREALTNTVKHAGANEAHVHVRRTTTGVAVDVADDGRTRSSRAVVGSGNGLTGLRERVESLGGRFEAGAADPGEHGWRVRAWLPVA